jgi:hypothetical protein
MVLGVICETAEVNASVSLWLYVTAFGRQATLEHPFIAHLKDRIGRLVRSASALARPLDRDRAEKDATSMRSAAIKSVAAAKA